MAINYSHLRCCIEAHPNWPDATDAEIEIWANTPNPLYNYRPAEAPARDIWDVIIQYGDYEQLTDGERDVIRTSLIGGGNNVVDISTNNTPFVKAIIRIMSGTTTLTALNNAFTYSRVPWEHFQVGKLPNEGHIAEARANWTCD